MISKKRVDSYVGLENKILVMKKFLEIDFLSLNISLSLFGHHERFFQLVDGLTEFNLISVLRINNRFSYLRI